MTRSHDNDNHPPRLLTKSQAAYYCGMSLSTFGGVCPVRPIALGDGPRMHRYDVHDIDKWIDGFKAGGGKPKSVLEQILEKKR